MVSIWKNKCSVLTQTKQEMTLLLRCRIPESGSKICKWIWDLSFLYHEPENMFLVGLQFALTHSKPACEDTKTKCCSSVYILKLANGKRVFRKGGLKGKKLKLVSVRGLSIWSIFSLFFNNLFSTTISNWILKSIYYVPKFTTMAICQLLICFHLATLITMFLLSQLQVGFSPDINVFF